MKSQGRDRSRQGRDKEGQEKNKARKKGTVIGQAG
jgi:hypothetical protein